MPSRRQWLDFRLECLIASRNHALPAGATVLRLLPPLVITAKEINIGAQAIAKAIKELAPY